MLLQFPGEDIISPFMFSFLDVCLCLCGFVCQSFGIVVLIRVMIYLMLYIVELCLLVSALSFSYRFFVGSNQI